MAYTSNVDYINAMSHEVALPTLKPHWNKILLLMFIT